jgi:hypothetical protein
MKKNVYSQEVNEFRIQLNKAIIPFEKFFHRLNESNINSTPIIDSISSKIEI